MGWVNSPDMFCVASETVSDKSNGYLLDPTSAFTIYLPTSGTYSLAPSKTASAARLQYVDVYMDYLNCATQGDVGQNQWASELTIRALKEIFPYLPTEVKDSVSLKKSLQGDGDLSQVKEIIGWIISTQSGTLRLPPKQLAELNILLDIPPSQRCMSTKKLERLIGNLCSIHLAIPGSVGHFYHLHMDLTAANHASRATAYISLKVSHRREILEIPVYGYGLPALLPCRNCSTPCY